MTNRRLWPALCAALFLLLGQGMALAAECATCDRNYAACRSPIQARYVICMNADNSRCGSKCTNDCRNDKEIQKCTVACVKNCQGGSSCQETFTSANAQCLNTYRACKKDCTIPR